MIRYVYIGDQIEEDGKQFAFFDTIKNRFLEWNYRQIFDDFNDFETYAKKHPEYERCKNLINNK